MATFQKAGDTVNITSGAASARVAFSGNVTEQRTLRIVNTGVNPVFFEQGDSTVTATTTASMCLNAGATDYVSYIPGATHLAVIGAVAGSVVYASLGIGE